MDTSFSILRFAKRFFAGTMLSRMSGALRDVVMAFCFGSAPEVGAFMVAYRLANLFRRLFGEGSLQSGFVPHFASLHSQDPKKALFFYRDTVFSLLLMLFAGVVIIETVLWGISSFFSWDWAGIISLSMKMVPGLVFICLYALNSAYLQYQKKYFVSAAAPVMFNVFWMAAAFLCYRMPAWEAMQFLSFGISCAFAMQWAMTAVQVRKSMDLSWKEWAGPRLFSPDWKQMMKPLSFAVIGVGAMQINSALDAIFSRISDLSGPAYLWYAIRIEQLPLALFGIALSGALLPPLSRAITEGALDRYGSLLTGAIRHSAALLVPCTFGLFSLGGAGLNLLYGHGDFTSQDVQQTMYCLWGYGIGLLPSVFVLLAATGFYAQKSYVIPMIASIASVIFHISMNALLIFAFGWGSFSIAVSTSAASVLNSLILLYFVKKRFGLSVFIRFWGFFGRLVFSSGAAAAAALFFGFVFFNDPTIVGGLFIRSFATQCMQLMSMSAVFLGIFFAFAYRLGIRELFDFFKRNEISHS